MPCHEPFNPHQLQLWGSCNWLIQLLTVSCISCVKRISNSIFKISVKSNQLNSRAMTKVGASSSFLHQFNLHHSSSLLCSVCRCNAVLVAIHLIGQHQVLHLAVSGILTYHLPRIKISFSQNQIMFSLDSKKLFSETNFVFFFSSSESLTQCLSHTCHLIMILCNDHDHYYYDYYYDIEVDDKDNCHLPSSEFWNGVWFW